MGRIIDFYFFALRVTIALLLAGMVVLVFGNVVLRYAFNQGITVSEELSRMSSSGSPFSAPWSPCASMPSRRRFAHQAPAAARREGGRALRPRAYALCDLAGD